MHRLDKENYAIRRIADVLVMDRSKVRQYPSISVADYEAFVLRQSE